MTSDPNDKYLDLLHEIEAKLITVYDRDFSLSDSMTIFALNKGKAAVKQAHGYGRGLNATPDNETEKDIVTFIVTLGSNRIGKVDDLTLAIYENCINQIIRSIERHRQYGVRGYYEFIKNYVE